MVHKKSLVIAFSSCINTLEYLVCAMDSSEARKHTNQRNKTQIGNDREIRAGLFWRFLLQFLEE